VKSQIFFILSLCISNIVSATIYISIDTTQLQTVTLSSSHQNRILVDGGRILKVIYPDDGSVIVTIEEESGQVFVHSMVPYPSPTTMSVVTNMGVVQDIEVHFVDQSSELIVLSVPSVKEGKFVQETCCLPIDRCWIESSTPEGIQEKVNAILKGNLPTGFRTCNQNGPVRMVKKNIRAENIAKVTSEYEDLYIWRLENISKFRSQKIWECELSFEGSSWIYLEKNCLNPGETITAIISLEK